MNTVYHINKGINKSVEFHGLKAQYIWYLGGGLVAALILFAILYIAGVNAYICAVVILTAGSCIFIYVYRMNNRYGEHGLMQKKAQKKIPKIIHCHSRKKFCRQTIEAAKK